jgi:microcystin-dependent protein
MNFENFYSILRKKLSTDGRIMGALFLVLITTVLISAPIQVPNVFQEGDIISAEEVNANFQVLQDRINQLSEDLANAQVEVLPVGTIVPFSGTSDKIPDGWLLCNGNSLEKTGDYATLYAIVGSSYGAEDGDHYSLPDLRGVFLRGHDPDATKDVDATGRVALRPDLAFYSGNTGNTIGSYQGDMFASHNHTASANGDHSHTVSDYTISWNAGSGGTGGRHYSSGNYNKATNSTGSHSHTISNTGGNETRVKNVAINYIIKYK